MSEKQKKKRSREKKLSKKARKNGTKATISKTAEIQKHNDDAGIQKHF